MKKILKLTAPLGLAFSVALGLSSAASAATLTFDSASGYPSSVTDGGFTFTLPGTPHFGDGEGNGQNLSWHAYPANIYDADATMTKNGGGNFSLTSVLVNAFTSTSSVRFSAAGYADQIFTSAGTYALSFLNVSSVTIDIGRGSASFDNFVVGEPSPVPVPASLPLLLAGLGAFGWVRRKKA